MSLMSLLVPELILIAVASVLLLQGLSNKASSRRLAPIIAMAALFITFGIQIYFVSTAGGATQHDGDKARYGTLRVGEFTQYINLIRLGMGSLLALLAWPNNDDAIGRSSLYFGHDGGEFFAVMNRKSTRLNSSQIS